MPSNLLLGASVTHSPSTSFHRFNSANLFLLISNCLNRMTSWSCASNLDCQNFYFNKYTQTTHPMSLWLDKLQYKYNLNSLETCQFCSPRLTPSTSRAADLPWPMIMSKEESTRRASQLPFWNTSKYSWLSSTIIVALSVFASFLPQVCFTFYFCRCALDFFRCWAEIMIECGYGLCCFLYWDDVGYVARFVHCLTLSLGGRAYSDFGQQKASKQNFIRESIQKIAQT